MFIQCTVHFRLKHFIEIPYLVPSLCSVTPSFNGEVTFRQYFADLRSVYYACLAHVVLLNNCLEII